MKPYMYLFFIIVPTQLSAQLYTPSTGGPTGNNNVGIVTSNAQAQLVVGDEFGALVSGSGGGYGIFGSNFAIYQGGTNSNKLYTPYDHSSFGYSGMRTNWGKIDFFTSAGATTAGQIITPTSRMTIDSDGNVGIGTNAPDTELTVKGVIHTNEVRVDMNSPIQGPDYVFEKDYDLLPLSELETYINKNKHLPEVPSAKEMEENGLNLKEMNLLLLKKVEELTLHLIALKKENESIKKDVAQLKRVK